MKGLGVVSRLACYSYGSCFCSCPPLSSPSLSSLPPSLVSSPRPFLLALSSARPFHSYHYNNQQWLLPQSSRRATAPGGAGVHGGAEERRRRKSRGLHHSPFPQCTTSTVMMMAAASLGANDGDKESASSHSGPRTPPPTTTTSPLEATAAAASTSGDDDDDDDDDDYNDDDVDGPRPSSSWLLPSGGGGGDDDVGGVAGGGGVGSKVKVKNAIEAGTVYFVATPLGNLGDMTVRARDVLAGVDLIASEDTRHTGLLLQALGIGKKRQVSHHQHNVGRRVPELVRMAKEERLAIAVVTDAGTPGVSDPGSELAAACWEAGVPVVPIPGSCAAVAALSVSGFVCSEFVFLAFLPRQGRARAAKLREVLAASTQGKAAIFYESPHRVVKTLQDLVAVGEEEGQGVGGVSGRTVLCGRELTKLHEELYRGSLAQAIQHFSRGGEASTPRGEFTVVLGPVGKGEGGGGETSQEQMEEQVRRELHRLITSSSSTSAEEGGSMSRSEAVKAVSKAMAGSGVSKSTVYAIALQMKKEEAEEEGQGQGKRKKKTGKRRPPPPPPS